MGTGLRALLLSRRVLRPRRERVTVRRDRPALRDVRPGNRDAPAISQRIGVRGCAIAGFVGISVTYTLMKTRGSREQSLQPESPRSEASFALRIRPLSLGAARLTAPHRPVRSRTAMAKPRDNGVRHPTRPRALSD